MTTEAFTASSLDREAINVAKALTADAIENCGSGHPGAAISLAGVAYLLYQYEMHNDPADPKWLGRDRFVLSAGHASMMQYAQLVLAGYGLEVSDLETLRTWESNAPGHPEFGRTAGVETTTGPLGAGFATAVGMAMAARREHALFDPHTPAGESVFDHMVYTVMGDGCMQEGVTSEAASLAGTQQLGNLVAIYDDNDISIDGTTDTSFTEDPSARFEAYGWQVIDVDWTHGGTEYSEDLAQLHAALVSARAESTRPTLIRLHTIIAWPSPNKQGTAASHGAKLGGEEVAALKEALGLDPERNFQAPEELLAATRANAARNAAEIRKQWDADYAAWRANNPKQAQLFDRVSRQELPADFASALPTFELGDSLATRVASGKTLTALADVLPELWGGSADLADSNNTRMVGKPVFLPENLAQNDGDGPAGRNIYFGVREHAMGNILNGIALDGRLRPYGGTFLVFADYMRPPVRLAALMELPSVFVWTHDSIGVGEDGPTHQPVEQVASLRAIPGLNVIRPADANETVAAWAAALNEHEAPCAMVLTRQNLPVVVSTQQAENVRRGAYVLAEANDADGNDVVPETILIATGSEVALALAAREQLQTEGVPTRVVSAPCLEWFAEQDAAYRESVLPAAVRARVSIEAGIEMGWHRYVGDAGRTVSLDHYGASAPGAELFERYGFTAANVAEQARLSLAAARG